MKIIVHDYAGHPFQVQLSRKLAARGHDVLHLYCASTHTPRGELDPPRRRSGRISHSNRIGLSETIPKTNFVRRLRLEYEYGPKLVASARRFSRTS